MIGMGVGVGRIDGSGGLIMRFFDAAGIGSGKY